MTVDLADAPQPIEQASPAGRSRSVSRFWSRFSSSWRTYGWRWAFFAICVAVRFPNLRWGAAPYAEEGVVYYSYATEHSVFDTLAFRFNYYSITANTAAVIEAALPIEMLRWISPLAGLVGPSVVVLLIARLQPNWRVALAIAVTVFTVSMQREWYSVIHAQFWFAAAMVVMVGAFGSTTGQRRSDYAIAFVAGLSGLLAVLAVPGLLAEAVRQRRDDRSATRHLARVAMVLALTSVVNRLLSTPRTRTMPFAEVIPTTFLKVIWQPITGDLGDTVGERLASASPIASNLIGVAGFITVALVLMLVLRERWLTSAMTAVFVAAASLVFSLPPSRDLATAAFGGRYALAGAVPLGIAIAIGATRRGGIVDDTLARMPVSNRTLNSVSKLRRMALATAVLWVVAAIHSGWLTSTWFGDNDLDQTATFVESVHALGPHATGTAQVDGECRIAPNPVATRAGLSVATSWQPDGSLRIEAESSDFDAGQPVHLYLLARIGDQNSRIDEDGNQRLEGFTFGVINKNLPGTCYPFSDDVAPTTTFVDRTVISIPATAFEGLDPRSTVRVGVGRSINDALALQSFKFVGLVSEADPDDG